MASPFRSIRSETAGAVPTAGQLEVGQIAVNIADRKFFTKNAAGTVVELSPMPGAGEVTLVEPFESSAVATNLAASTFNAVSDPYLRRMVDLRHSTKMRIMGDFKGSVATATKMRIQYHTGGNWLVSSGDGGWATLGDSAGSHTIQTPWVSSEITIPTAARIKDCVIRCGIYDGNGTADPLISTCFLYFGN